MLWSGIGTQEPCRHRSPAWPQAEVLRTRIEGLRSPRARRALTHSRTRHTPEGDPGSGPSRCRRPHARGDVLCTETGRSHPCPERHAGPAHEGNSRTMGMYADEKSDEGIGPMHERLRAFELALHPDKTRLIRFGRQAASSVRALERESLKRSTFSASRTSARDHVNGVRL